MSSYLESFLAELDTVPTHEGTELTKPTEAPSVSSVSAPPSSSATRLPDRGLAVQEVLSFPAALLADLPLATSLVIGPRRRIVPASSRECRALIDSAALGPRATVGAVLEAHHMELVAVVIEGDGGQT